MIGPAAPIDFKFFPIALAQSAEGCVKETLVWAFSNRIAGAIADNINSRTSGETGGLIGHAISPADRDELGWASADLAPPIITDQATFTLIISFALGLGTIEFVGTIVTISIAIANQIFRNTAPIVTEDFALITSVYSATTFIAAIGAINDHAVAARYEGHATTISTCELILIAHDWATVLFVSTAITINHIITTWHAPAIVRAGGCALRARTARLAMCWEPAAFDIQLDTITGLNRAESRIKTGLIRAFNRGRTDTIIRNFNPCASGFTG
jgi:hypothetical protein